MLPWLGLFCLLIIINPKLHPVGNMEENKCKIGEKRSVKLNQQLEFLRFTLQLIMTTSMATENCHKRQPGLRHGGESKRSDTRNASFELAAAKEELARVNYKLSTSEQQVKKLTSQVERDAIRLQNLEKQIMEGAAWENKYKVAEKERAKLDQQLKALRSRVQPPITNESITPVQPTASAATVAPVTTENQQEPAAAGSGSENGGESRRNEVQEDNTHHLSFTSINQNEPGMFAGSSSFDVEDRVSGARDENGTEEAGHARTRNNESDVEETHREDSHEEETAHEVQDNTRQLSVNFFNIHEAAMAYDVVDFEDFDFGDEVVTRGYDFEEFDFGDQEVTRGENNTEEALDGQQNFGVVPAPIEDDEPESASWRARLAEYVII